MPNAFDWRMDVRASETANRLVLSENGKVVERLTPKPGAGVVRIDAPGLHELARAAVLGVLEDAKPMVLVCTRSASVLTEWFNFLTDLGYLADEVPPPFWWRFRGAYRGCLMLRGEVPASFASLKASLPSLSISTASAWRT